jgi:hypothetical protein
MPALFLGVVVLMLFAAYFFSKADPKQVVRVLRYIGGGAALLFAVFLLIRGEIGPAVSIALLGLGLIGYVSLWPANFGGRGQKSPGRTSHARRRFWKWNSTTVAIPYAVRFYTGRTRAWRSTISTWQP